VRPGSLCAAPFPGQPLNLSLHCRPVKSLAALPAVPTASRLRCGETSLSRSPLPVKGVVAAFGSRNDTLPSPTLPNGEKPPQHQLRGLFEGWPTGVEPATSGTTIRRSNRLSYGHHATPKTKKTAAACQAEI
jgi:hypothetical protein